MKGTWRKPRRIEQQDTVVCLACCGSGHHITQYVSPTTLRQSDIKLPCAACNGSGMRVMLDESAIEDLGLPLTPPKMYKKMEQ